MEQPLDRPSLDAILATASFSEGVAEDPMLSESARMRREGWRLARQGALWAIGGALLLLITLLLLDSAPIWFGALPLFGGGAVGFGFAQGVLGSRLSWLRWVVAVVAGVVVFGAAVLLIELLVGPVFV